MTIYKILKVVEKDSSVGKFVGQITVTRRKILGYIQEKEDADRFIRCYLLEHPNAQLTTEPIDVGNQKGEEDEPEV